MSAAALPRILTVEDDPIVRADLRLILEDNGFDVCAGARDGLEAVELAREHAPDLVLIDLNLPRLDGVEATRRILDERAVPVVALTGYASGGAIEREDGCLSGRGHRNETPSTVARRGRLRRRPSATV